LTNGYAIPAILALIAWIYLEPGETITTSNTVFDQRS
jgi:hypothetical protein